MNTTELDPTILAMCNKLADKKEKIDNIRKTLNVLNEQLEQLNRVGVNSDIQVCQISKIGNTAYPHVIMKFSVDM